MGIDINQWRARIGCFSQPVKKFIHIQTLKIKHVSFALRLVLFLLLVVQGIESNPGPRPGRNSGVRGRGSNRSRGYNVPEEDTQTDMQTDAMITRRSSRHINSASQNTMNSNNRPQLLQQELTMWFSEIDNPQSQNQSQVSDTNNQPISEDLDNQLYQDTEQNQSDTEIETDLEVNSNEADIDPNSDLKTLLLDIRKDVKQINHKFDTMKKSVKELKQSNKQLQRQNENLTKVVSELKEQVNRLEVDSRKNTEANEKLESQSRRSNLILYGIAGNKRESWEESEEKFREYLSNNLKIDQTKIQTERVHRLNTKSSPAPIIVKFSFFKDREKVLKAYKEKRKTERESQTEEEGRVFENAEQPMNTVRVGEDFPVRVRNVRKKLVPFLRKCLSEKKNAFMKYDKLVIDNDIYEYDSEKKVPVLVTK